MSNDISASPVTIGEANWQQYGACRDFGPELFYSHQKTHIAVAKTICRICPVSTHCALYTTKEPDGVWAGRTSSERRVSGPAPLVRNPMKDARLGYQALDQIATMMKLLKRVPQEQEVNRAAREGLVPSTRVIRRIFGSWGMFKKVLALHTLRAFAKDLPEIPRADLELKASAREGLTYSYMTLNRYFGSYLTALRLAGVSTRARTRVSKTDAQLKNEFVRLCLDYGHVLSSYELERFASQGLCSWHTTYVRRFGSHQELTYLCRNRLRRLASSK